MSDEQIIREFLDSKPGYIKTGANKIAQITGVSDTTLIKKILKESKGLTVNYQVEEQDKPPIEMAMAKVPELTPEYIAALRAALAQPTVIEIGNAPSSSMFTPKQPVDQSVFDTEGIHLLMGCNHVPFHNQELHSGILELIKDLDDKMVGFHIMGDFMDVNSLSSHDRGRFTAVPGLTLENEYLAANAELERFERALPKTVIDKSYLYGNHEDRVFRYNADMQNAKNPAVLPHDALALRERGYSVKERWSQDFITLGGMDLFHGIYFNIHNAKKHLDTFNKSSAYVHTHRSQMYREGDNAAYNIGACANFNSPAFNYATRAMKNAWANGFALVHVDAKGQHYVTQIDVKHSKFFYNGKEY